MTADFRALCAELYAIFEKYDDESNLAGIYSDMEADGNDLFDRARAALAEPPAEADRAERGGGVMNTPDLRSLVAEMAHELDHARRLLLDDRTLTDPLADRARALLAQPEPQPSADGEVGELVAWLGVISQQFRLADLNDEAVQTDRAADLLERLAAIDKPGLQVEPIPVSERLPEAGDCDDSLCWQWLPDINGHHPLGRWELQHRDWLSDFNGEATHWLPAYALPLPSGEGE